MFDLKFIEIFFKVWKMEKAIVCPSTAEKYFLKLDFQNFL